MSILRFLSPRFAAAFFRNVLLKLRYRNSIQINIFKTYISPGVVVAISGGGAIRFKEGGRIFVGSGCELRASGGILEIGPNVFFNRNCSVVSHVAITIGADCMFGPSVCIYDSDHNIASSTIPFRLQGFKKLPVTLGYNVWVGANSVVTRGSQVGDSTAVGACSLVRGSLDGAGVYAGNPIRLVRSIESVAPSISHLEAMPRGRSASQAVE